VGFAGMRSDETRFLANSFCDSQRLQMMIHSVHHVMARMYPDQYFAPMPLLIEQASCA
jgi:hypothetical protein